MRGRAEDAAAGVDHADFDVFLSHDLLGRGHSERGEEIARLRADDLLEERGLRGVLHGDEVVEDLRVVAESDERRLDAFAVDEVEVGRRVHRTSGHAAEVVGGVAAAEDVGDGVAGAELEDAELRELETGVGLAQRGDLIADGGRNGDDGAVTSAGDDAPESAGECVANGLVGLFTGVGQNDGGSGGGFLQPAGGGFADPAGVPVQQYGQAGARCKGVSHTFAASDSVPPTRSPVPRGLAVDKRRAAVWTATTTNCENAAVACPS